MEVPKSFVPKNTNIELRKREVSMFFDENEEDVIKLIHDQTEEGKLVWNHTVKAYGRLEYRAVIGDTDLVCERKKLSSPADYVMEEEFNLKVYYQDRKVFCSSRVERYDTVETLWAEGDENLKRFFWLVEGKYEDRQRLYSKDEADQD